MKGKIKKDISQSLPVSQKQKKGTLRTKTRRKRKKLKVIEQNPYISNINKKNIKNGNEYGRRKNEISSEEWMLGHVLSLSIISG